MLRAQARRQRVYLRALTSSLTSGVKGAGQASSSNVTWEDTAMRVDTNTVVVLIFLALVP
jgi:hypothetical protein